MKRILTFTALLCLLLFATTARAAKAGTALVLQFNGGGQLSFYLSEEPLVTFEGSNMKIEYTGTTFVYPRADISDFHFVKYKDGVGIDDVASGELRIVRRSPDAMTLYGLSDGDCRISVCDINGRQMQPQVTTADGAVTVSLAAMPTGVYILKIGNQKTIKFIKK